MTQIKSLVDAIDSFIKGTKADGDWDAIKASCIMAGWDGLAGCLTPLRGPAPTNVGPFVTGDYNRITGLIGNGSSKYLNSNRNNNTDPQDSNHNAVYCTDLGTTSIARVPIGAGVTEGGVNVVGFNAEGTVFHRNRSATATTSGNQAIGLTGISRSESTGYSRRADGTTASITMASQVPFGNTITVFRRNGSVPSYLDGRLSFYSIGESLNLANLDTRVTTLMTAIGEALS